MSVWLHYAFAGAVAGIASVVSLVSLYTLHDKWSFWYYGKVAKKQGAAKK